MFLDLSEARDLQTFPEPQTLRAPDDLARGEPTLREFAEWVRTKPADEEYDYGSSTRCAFYQYAVQFGIPNPVRSQGGTTLPAALWWPLATSPHTYSALASRLASLSARVGEEVAR